MKNKKIIWIVLLLGFLWFPLGRFMLAAPGDEPDTGIVPELKLFSKALGVILEGYVSDLKPRELLYQAVRGMLSTLDPYSQFINQEQYPLLKIDMNGEYSGIGAILEIVEEFVAIKEIQHGTAAEVAGLLIHDKILKVDGVSVKKKTIPEVASLLRGEENTKVVLTVQREPGKKILDFTVIRKKIEISAVNDVRIVGKAIGYMRIDNWQEHTVGQADIAIAKLTKNGMKALVIDLRNNEGGLMASAIALAERFLPKDKKLISVDSKIDVQKKQFYSPGEKTIPDCRLVVLVNERSASASEIFSASIQDNGRGTILGVKTFGKASVQSVIPFDEHTAIKLTTARYVSPNGRVIDGIGIQPDVVVEYGKSGDSSEDQQIRKALDLLKEYM